MFCSLLWWLKVLKCGRSICFFCRIGCVWKIFLIMECCCSFLFVLIWLFCLRCLVRGSLFVFFLRVKIFGWCKFGDILWFMEWS